jgi:hypothetical protein
MNLVAAIFAFDLVETLELGPHFVDLCRTKGAGHHGI